MDGSIKSMENDLATLNQDTVELKQQKAVLLENLNKIQRQISKIVKFEILKICCGQFPVKNFQLWQNNISTWWLSGL